ncbi:hypothetical protein AU468_10775 [Alkalispirochaeta sphaeroplastigenens]|uniref:DUF554 domain-containing protein n=1 Tax=Alkalispirochaeta sphaeroplastigenens TaxID=1187066 RepID=A0A2S4JHW1_9SPIO|nr:DUF554 domain-containing protein [Alkalispirochaeta sphaeroplastigenens]POQ99091.1 hypothetical protein AU468_10775 [Alkalispirochaeta sphaeroplastigenens]
MIATVVNVVAVILGTMVGLLAGKGLGGNFRSVVFTGIGVVTILLGVQMALETERILYLVISLVVGGLAGTALEIEDRIYRWGEMIKRRLPRHAGSDHSFAEGFLMATVLFCVGALAIIGAFQAGVEQRYSLLLTKSVMDGAMAVLLTAAYGLGVGFSAIPILLYQGGLTLAAGLLSPLVTPLMLSEISGAGGAIVVMIGLNLLELRKIKTADFLPALVVVVLLVVADPWIGRFIL